MRKEGRGDDDDEAAHASFCLLHCKCLGSLERRRNSGGDKAVVEQLDVRFVLLWLTFFLVT